VRPTPKPPAARVSLPAGENILVQTAWQRAACTDGAIRSLPNTAQKASSSSRLVSHTFFGPACSNRRTSREPYNHGMRVVEAQCIVKYGARSEGGKYPAHFGGKTQRIESHLRLVSAYSEDTFLKHFIHALLFLSVCGHNTRGASEFIRVLILGSPCTVPQGLRA